MGYLIRGKRARFEFFYGRFLSSILKDLHEPYDLLVINQIEYLHWAGFDSPSLLSVPVYLDIHEDNVNIADRGLLEMIAFREYWRWQLLELSKFVAKRGNIRISSVEKIIAESYSNILGMPVEIILNAPDTNELLPIPVSRESIKLVHHGMGTKGRGIETTIWALRELDGRFRLDLILFSTPVFKLKIEILSRLLGVRKRIRILRGVPLSALPEILNGYDISVILLSDKIPGHRNAFPNKFFESIHSKLAIVTGPNPSMAKLVSDHNIGYSMSSWSKQELVRTLSKVSAQDLNRFKTQTVEVARKYSSSQSRDIFHKLIGDLLNREIDQKDY